MKVYSSQNNNDPCTTDLADFGVRELSLLIDLLEAMKHGYPDDFEEDGVVPMLNRNSGEVFLTNSSYQVCMEVNGELESWYFTPYGGHEGFLEDLIEDYQNNPDDWDEEDVEYLRDLGADV